MGKEFQTLLRGEDCKRWRKVLKALVEKNKKQAFYFRTPVDAVALGIPHYASVIDRPMDLGTIERRLDLNDYASWEAFSTDVRLVFTNAMTFNRDPAHQVHAAARFLLALFETRHDEVSETPGKRPGGVAFVGDDDDEAPARRGPSKRRHGGGNKVTPRATKVRAFGTGAGVASPVPAGDAGAASSSAAPRPRRTVVRAISTDDCAAPVDGGAGDAMATDDDDVPRAVDGMVPATYLRRLGVRMQRMKRRMEDLQRTLDEASPRGALPPSPAAQRPAATKIRMRLGSIDNYIDALPQAQVSPYHDVEISPEEERAYTACIVAMTDDDDDARRVEADVDERAPRSPRAAKPRARDGAASPLCVASDAVDRDDADSPLPLLELSTTFELGSTSPLWALPEEESSQSPLKLAKSFSQ
ncbi:hypothetical protein M885DRAFT_517057 [Pelagophyceae sp. CCMP2097]|nr:hypothetical protein M885DRAFT_517057 [Pelagophyceae sp. CCMP2097]